MIDCFNLPNLVSNYIGGSFTISKSVLINLFNEDVNSSAFYFADPIANVSITECLFEKCIALKGYGAVTLHSCFSLKLEKNIFKNNIASLGPDLFILWTMDNYFSDFTAISNSYFRSETRGYVGNHIGAKGSAVMQSQNFTNLFSTSLSRFSAFAVYMINIDFNIKNTILDKCSGGIGIVEITSQANNQLHFQNCAFVNCESNYFIAAEHNWTLGTTIVESSSIYNNNFTSWKNQWISTISLDKCYFVGPEISPDMMNVNPVDQKYPTEVNSVNIGCRVIYKKTSKVCIGLTKLLMFIQCFEGV